MVEHPPSFKGQRRNATVVTAIWVLGIIAFLELLFASIALAPRILTAVRNSQATHDQPVVTQAAIPASTPSVSQQIQKQLSANPQDNSASLPLDKNLPPSEAPQQSTASDNSPQGGSTLAIVSAKLDGSDEGSKKLLITIKANPNIPIDVPQVKVQVYFYDTDGTEITPSKAQVTSSWTSPPVDWKDGEPELLEVRYLPDSADSDIKFAGYVVAIYYKGDLQDYRAEPGQLTKLFPLKYFIGTDE